MKKYLYLLMLAGCLVTQAYSSPYSPHKPAAPQVTLEQQIARYVSYPSILKSTRLASVVVIQFRLNEASEVCQLKVFSQNDELNNSLLRQLTSKKLVGYGRVPDELYTVRLHFEP
ncbi:MULTISPECIES: hypothetical protein [unclassified Spirosoma]|uniref:hypothetical protein n=1 Tax=unclassified Spirosoma TaxID=2621999 RepID=UPI00095A582B|nr:MULTISPECIES: hypothetical protein [unclassified Spirosoma]MBN8826283.1 hypothetical protein [Spirosoma sp.]OJW75183.1 MAG: hypothetical protein BGO59_17980 [Spirosoma sp. 48-14]